MDAYEEQAAASARHRVKEFGAVRISSVTLPARAGFPAGMLAEHGGPRLYLVDRGGVELAGADHAIAETRLRTGSTLLRTGSALVCADARRPEISALRVTTLIVVSAPPDLWRQSGLDADRAHVLASSSPLLAPAAAFIASACMPGTSAGEPPVVEQLLLMMLLGVFAGAARVRRVPRGPDRFAAAMSAIAGRCADPDPSPNGVAHALAVSPRELEREFRMRDTTVCREIRLARAQKAPALLTDPRQRALTLEQLAAPIGFRDGSGPAREMRTEGAPSSRRVRAAATSRDATRVRRLSTS